MLLIKDAAIEKPENALDSALESHWFGYGGKPNINRTGLRADFEGVRDVSGFVTLIAGIPTVQVQPASLFTTSPEWKTQEELTLPIYGVRERQWSSDQVGYAALAAYPISAGITVVNTGAFSLVSAAGEAFSVGYTIVGSLNDEMELPESIERRLDKIRGLRDNWDSYSASRISGKAVEKAKLLLIEAGIHCGVTVLEEAFIAPCSDGGIQLEWRSDSEKELISKILPSGKTATFLLTEPSGKEKEGTIKGLKDWDGLLDALCSKRKSLR